ncbi:type II toxin-antitoxin system Phd/YefM family antitoxin [Desulfonatronum thiodismutans]|uniref:type II toxin-antitoxin system Phd/YefM family antitoxin n=1 Tax=Desulfonatronum thiodismutans TaxID=159290 RepID=UPI0004ABE85B|nr:type II toxin-antitoxin system Phd/YefM family antitoxin [Desulfonatronum thiodismutans]
METLSIGEARDHFAELLNRTSYAKERVVLTRHGKRLAAMVPLEDLELLELLEDRLDIEQARNALAEAGTDMPWDELKKQLSLGQ